MNEADTCREYVLPRLDAAGWNAEPHRISEQVTFTDGRIIPVGKKIRRGKQKRADYLLRYRRDFSIAVVEAKAVYKEPGDGLQQAKQYAEMLGLKFAYASNGTGIVEFDYITGREAELQAFPTPTELWARLNGQEPLADAQIKQLLTPCSIQADRTLRYYQMIAINRSVQAIIQGKPRVLLTMATGTGKTEVAFQICWKLWSSRWNRAGAHRRPKILYLTDRNVLVDDPKDKEFAPFGEARHKMRGGRVVTSRDMYFAIYQAIAGDQDVVGLFRQYPPDFFDLIIVDECHRGSAATGSHWREILDYFKSAVHLGMTATPLREDNKDTYAYFGAPIYTYSLRQGIDDGFLAPYRVHRIITSVDAAGWQPGPGELDRYGREIPEGEYGTKDFERILALRARTETIALHLTNFLKKTDRYAKTIVFCVDQEHALEMRRALTNLNTDLTQQYPDYVCRVTADEGSFGRTHLSDFQDVETQTPVILTTSQLLSTGVNAPMVKNIVLARVVGSMTEFKQIIGRGTRVRDDLGKFTFNILDYTGSATRHFADPDFDGYPAITIQEKIGPDGEVLQSQTLDENPAGSDEGSLKEYEPIAGAGETTRDGREVESRKYYVDDGVVEIIAHLVYDLDASGKRHRVVQYDDYAGTSVRSLYPTAAALREKWMNPEGRDEIVEKLAERGIDFDELAAVTGMPEADPFDLLCHVAFNAPLRTRRERAERLRKDRAYFFDRFGQEARAILNDLLDKYTDHGITQFRIPEALKVKPISNYGTPTEIIKLFGSADVVRRAVADLQRLLYAA